MASSPRRAVYPPSPRFPAAVAEIPRRSPLRREGEDPREPVDPVAARGGVEGMPRVVPGDRLRLPREVEVLERRLPRDPLVVRGELEEEGDGGGLPDEVGRVEERARP